MKTNTKQWSPTDLSLRPCGSETFFLDQPKPIKWFKPFEFVGFCRFFVGLKRRRKQAAKTYPEIIP